LIGVDSGYKSEVQGGGAGKVVITIQQMKPAVMVRTIVQWSLGLHYCSTGRMVALLLVCATLEPENEASWRLSVSPCESPNNRSHRL
jgi:hypothetical protein